jgi:hypothetical protein
MKHRLTILVPALALVAAGTACDRSSTSPNAAATRFVISQVAPSGATASLVALDDNSGPPDDRGNSVPLSAIASIDVEVTGVAALPVGEDPGVDADWVKIPVDPSVGTLAAGTYDHVRILFDQATITLTQTLTLGNGSNVQTYEAGTPYPLYIGGFGLPDDCTQQQAEDGNHFGIVIPATTFTVTGTAGETVSIAFDPNASVKRVLVTGHGLRLAPVITAAKQEHDQNRNRAGQNG